VKVSLIIGLAGLFSLGIAGIWLAVTPLLGVLSGWREAVFRPQPALTL
jgi:hypothetical protein